MWRTLGVTLGLLTLCAAPAAASPDRIDVDFARPLDAPSMVGFVHGMDHVRPARKLIEPLHPQMWRGRPADVPYSRVERLGGRYTYVLSDRWGYPGGGRQAPYEDYGAWARFVRETARAVGPGTVVWDIWNEPDSRRFWAGTSAQLYKTYRIAEAVLRQELGSDVVIGGPSTSAWRYDWAVGLLEYCRHWRCEVNVLSWHELDGASIPGLADHLHVARDLERSPRYARQRIQELHVNEALAARDQYRPGELLGTWHYLEEGGASASARACWDDLAGDSNCYNDSLAGLVVPGTDQPRSVWWATKAYADGVGSRRASRSNDPQVVALPSAHGERPRTAQVLVAHMQRRPGGRRQAADVRVTLRGLDALPWLGGRHWLRVSVEWFPDTGEQPLERPEPYDAVRVPIEDGTAVLTMLDVRVHEAYRLTLG